MKPLKQIAKELGVSSAAVSYVYNNKWRENRINEKLAERIKKKIAEENASPDFLATQLRTGKTQTIGVILADLERPYNLSILSGIEQELSATNNLVLLGNSKLGMKETNFLETMIARKVDGLIICPMQHDEVTTADLFKQLAPGGLPLVFIDNYIKNSDIPYVISDNEFGAYQATKHCIKSNCKNIAYFGSAKRNPVLDGRYDGYKAALKEVKLEVIHSFEHSQDSFIELVIEKCDAMFVESFIYFDETMKLLQKKGVRIPGDIMLTGFDEPSLSINQIISSPLPYVQQNAEEMGKEATKQLLTRISGATQYPKETHIKPTLSWNKK